MTITLQAVNELIASLESAGELSIREQKFLKLAKAFKQLAAENVALKSAITDHSQSVHFCEVCGMDDPCRTDDVCYVLSETPATDRIVAGIKADGVEEWVSSRGGRWNGTTEEALKFAKQLREGKSEEVKS
ncbi:MULTISPECIES: hypothetical protein [Klebsiella pneumoniae complex]|uniref:hypothetical protein n=1 Tax=Klebsiella pneumoniae complex TaxID=3390273 RepID=UPI00132FC8B0|nr:hypothetical protein [Klebsiella pneumoniae]MBC4065314.1 hypothetical protein [Klebsiella pneumoniae]MCP3629927.1 hypothetical protein [Klebsiella pneumoniae]MCP3640331.1 hypothetical protein [Klebsiella pneumoniae]MDZ1529047.1 hypothetical protein [Klebsiella pneumoniae]QUX12653.1 hypothetical protein KFK82_13980 [Klebsiella pneumoniae]